MKILKTISQGEMIPPWYGVAWRDYARDTAICFPVPLNILAMLAHHTHIFLKCGSREIINDPRQAYAQGLRDGKKSQP